MRRLASVAIIALAVVAAVLGFRACYADRARVDTADARACYYDGRPRADCPAPRTGPHADTAWIHAGVIDTLYVRLPGAVGPATLVALYATTIPAPLVADGEARLADALVEAAPALPRTTAATLAARLRGASDSRATLAPLFTLGERQKRYDSATAARVASGGAATRDEALPSRGLLSLSRPALDDARSWALVYAERVTPPRRTDDAATTERAYVLLSRLPDGRWRAVRVLGA